MRYKSTRGGVRDFTSAEAIIKGIAPDGGLFVPEGFSQVTLDEIYKMSGMTYRQRAEFILKKYLDDYSEEDLKSCIDGAYRYPDFDTPAIAPIKKLGDQINVLELWHGPTSAFKDMALQILPHFLVKAMKSTGEKSEMVILVATSGDTGKAALDGFCDVDGTKIIVFFPNEGVSAVQRKQMVTQEGKNVSVYAVDGNFDDAQSGVKEIFTDVDLEKQLNEAGIKFTSANSINWGRLIPQVVYYFSGYADMIAQASIEAGDKINIVVPTGNFGNILAGFYAMKMGLPVNKFICASNENNVLTEFINTGKYDRNRKFVRTISPSMDILISSNLERLLYHLADETQVIQWMMQLKTQGEYQLGANELKTLQNLFYGNWCNEGETLKSIAETYDKYKYVIDTHTSVAFNVYEKYVHETGDNETKTMIVSTASPFKFNESVATALLGSEDISGLNEFDLLKKLSESFNLEIPNGLKDLDKKEVRFNQVCSKSAMKDTIRTLLLP